MSIYPKQEPDDMGSEGAVAEYELYSVLMYVLDVTQSVPLQRILV